jgi:hypothetical protein
MPFNIAAGNSSGYNYASGRLDHQTYFKAIRVEQAHLGDIVLDRIFAAWLDEAVLIEGYLPQSLRSARCDLPHQWFWTPSDSSRVSRLRSRDRSRGRSARRLGTESHAPATSPWSPTPVARSARSASHIRWSSTSTG